jgi:hypothetical protein
MVKVVQAVPLGKKIFKTSADRLKRGADRPVARGESPGHGTRFSLTVVFDRVAVRHDAHLCYEVWKVQQRFRRLNCQRATCIQTEKVDPRLIANAYVRADVQLGKLGDPRQRWHASRRHVRHVKRNDAEPRRPVEQIKRKVGRNLTTEGFSINRPMREEQVVPGLCHDPRAVRHWPGPMRDLFQDRAIEVVTGHMVLN